MRIALLFSLLLLPIVATSSEKPASASHLLPAVVVEARGATPPLVRYTRGGKVVWLLGGPGLLPKGASIDWSGAEARIAESDVLVGMRGLVLGENVGVFRALTLWPSIRRVRFNANDATLEDLLPPEAFAQWRVAQDRYLGGDRGNERLRPMYAAFELYRAALADTGLVEQDVASEVGRIARRHGVPMIDARARLSIAAPKKTVRAFDVPREADIRCLQDTLDRLDAYLPAARARGEAWLAGDFDVASAPSGRDSLTPCWATLTNDTIARGEGVTDLDGFVRDAWRDRLHDAVAEHDVVFAMVPTRDLMEASGLVAALEQAGFRPESTSQPMPHAP